MKGWGSTTMQRALIGGVAMLALVAARPDAMFAVTPVNGGSVGGSTVVIDASPGNQTDPHVSGDLVAYTDEVFGAIRYYDFFSATPAAIATPMGSTDQLSNVDGSHISFARKTGPDRACQVFDVASGTTTQIGPDGSGAFSTALGSDTVAFVSADDIKTGRISAPADPLVNLSTSPDLDFSPAVSPSGTAVVWQRCDLSSADCDVMKSTLSGGAWSAAQVVSGTSAYELSPDTDGVLIVYDSDRAGSDSGADIYYQPLAGGAEAQLAIPGTQRNPSIRGGVIAFESTAPGHSSADLFVYDLATNTVYQVTNTPTDDEQLSDITAPLPNGDIRVVWASHPDSTPDNDIFARAFTLPAATDTTPPAVTITTPADGAIYTKDQVVFADYFCDDEPGGSGLASCDGPVANGAPIDTASVGGHLFAVTSADNDGNEATLEHGYGVVFSVSPFAPPVDDLPVINSVKAGQAIPVKFSLGGDQGLAIFAAGYPKSQQVACSSTAPVDGIEETVTAGGSSLSYDASSGLYKYVWKTDKSWAGSCRQLVIGLVDGTFHRANFKLR